MSKAAFAFLAILLLSIVLLFTWQIGGKGDGQGNRNGLLDASESNEAGELSEVGPGIPEGHQIVEEDIQPSRSNASSFLVGLEDANGNPVEGEVYLIRHTKALDERLIQGMRSASWLWGDAVLFEERTLNGLAQFELTNKDLEGGLAALVFARGFTPVAEEVKFGLNELRIILSPITPIKVKVVTKEGRPISNAVTYLRPGRLGFEYETSDDWVAGLQMRGFGARVEADDLGVGLFETVYSGPRNTIQVNPVSGFASTSFYGLNPGDSITAVCGDAFSALGVVRDLRTRQPIEGAMVIFSAVSDSEWRTVYSLSTDANGKYRLEILPANEPVVQIEIRADGYVMQEFQWFHPKSQSVQRQDFFLEKAVGVSMQLVTSWGEPIRDSYSYFRARRFDEGPSAGRTDEGGFLHSDSLLSEAKIYALILALQDSVWLQVNQLIQPSDDKIVVPGLAQIAEVRLDEEQFPKGATGELSWAVLATEANGEITWPLGEKSPILPAGPGRLTLRTESTALQMQAELEENGDNVIDFRATPAALNFEWLGPNPATVTLYGEGDFLLIDEQEFAPGPIRIPCWEGNFRLTVTHEGGKREIPVTVTAPSVDIGPIGGADTAAIYGRVMGADGPFPGVYVDLDLPEGAIAASSLTDEEGYFRIEGLAPGEYNLFLTGDTMFGPDMPEQRRAIFLKPGEEQGPFALTFLSSVDGLHGKVVGETPAGTAAWMLVDGHVEQDLIEPDRSFHLRRPLADTTVGLTTMRRGLVMVTTEQVPAGAQQMEIGVPSSEHQLKIVDLQGKPRTDVVVQAFYHGAVLPFQAVPDNGGRLTFRVQRGLDVDLQFRLPDGSVELMDYDDIANHREITLPTSEHTIPVQVQDAQGDPIHGAVAMRYGVGDVMHADGYGKLLLAETETKWPYQITADGYLGQWITPKEKEIVILQPLLSGLRLDLSGVEERSTIVKLRLTLSGLPDGAAFAESFSLPYSGAASVALPPLPECSLRIDLLNSQGEVLSQKSIALGERGHQLEF